MWYLQRPCVLVVQLAPGLPVRDSPALGGSTCGERALGEAVVAIAECHGWLELRAAHTPRAHAAGCRCGGGGRVGGGGGRMMWWGVGVVWLLGGVVVGAGGGGGVAVLYVL